jgi:hypothetical protein
VWHQGSDLTDAEWRLISCQWRYIPKDLPPRSTVNGLFLPLGL